MAPRPICEPVELPPGVSVIAERVRLEQGESAIGDFMHFHDVAELVLFRRARGSFIAGGRTHQLGDRTIVFVPSMQHHDFLLEGAAMEWLLIQFDPDLLESLAPWGQRLSGPFCFSPDERNGARIDMLADWLLEAANQADPKTERITELLLLALAQAAEQEPAADPRPSPVERLLPALELLRRAPQDPIGLDEAACVCRVSPAYFSRRFRQLFGMTFTDYLRTYRLRLAARRLVASGAPVSEIAYGVGFSSPAHFSARFGQRFGMTPSQYRASARKRSGR